MLLHFLNTLMIFANYQCVCKSTSVYLRTSHSATHKLFSQSKRNVHNVLNVHDVKNILSTHKNYSDTHYYFTGVIIENKLISKAESYDDDPSYGYYVGLVASHQINTTILDICKKVRIFRKYSTEINKKHAQKFRKRFLIGQTVIWKRKRIGGKC